MQDLSSNLLTWQQFVILVGGFGKSRYLYQYLSLNIGEQIQILQGTGERP